MFFDYNQNNSGGSFDYDDEAGITETVIIEASNASDANRRAGAIGIYFNGCEDGRDCDCCGDRWYPAWGDGDERPSVYWRPVEEVPPKRSFVGRADGPCVYVHYADGTIKGFGQ